MSWYTRSLVHEGQHESAKRLLQESMDLLCEKRGIRPYFADIVAERGGESYAFVLMAEEVAK